MALGPGSGPLDCHDNGKMTEAEEGVGVVVSNVFYLEVERIRDG